MLINYLITALRVLYRDKFYAALNILGLSVGLAVCLLIFLFVRDELSYESGFTDASRIYRVGGVFKSQQVESREARISWRAADLLRQDFQAELEGVTRLTNVDDGNLFTVGEQGFFEDRFYLADEHLLSVLDFPFAAGDPDTALSEANSIVISERLARRWFGNNDALGQVITFDNHVDLQITGVLADMSNTHLRIDLLAPESMLSTLYGENMLDELDGWGWPSTYTFIKTRSGYDISAVATQLAEFETRNNVQAQLDLHIQPLTDIHLHSNIELEMQANGNIQTVWVFSGIALLILLIASINFMNLATARSAQRAREVAIRKTMGGRRTQLVMQFMGEAFILTLIALMLALVLMELMLSPFNEFVGKQLTVSYLNDWSTSVGLLVFAIVAATGAGCYPALFLSGVKPLGMLRGNTTTSRSNGNVRRVLVILQFAISIALIVSTSVIYLQMQFARAIDTGYAREAVVVVHGLPHVESPADFQIMKQRLLEHSSIDLVSMADTVPTTPAFSGTSFDVSGTDFTESQFFRYNTIGFGFFDTLDISMVAGRDFSEEYGIDYWRMPSNDHPHVQSSVIINEAAVAKLGWESAEQALENQLSSGGENRSMTMDIVGVVSDIQYSSLDYAIEPMIYLINSEEAELNMLIKISTADLSGTLAYIDRIWAEQVPDYPVVRSFLDDMYEDLLRQEQRSATLMSLFSALAILISCMGIVGLAAFMTEQRRKEIGLRKVLGSTVLQLVIMLTNDFSKLVLIANVIAWPLAYLGMESWLQQFAYRIDLTPLIFIGSGLIALCIAWVTVGGTAARAAMHKPVLALRYE